MPEARRAVVIEDDPDIRGLLVRILVKQGFEVTQAEAGLPGVEEVRRATPDLVTLDLNLPDLDGLEVCKLLREFSDAFIVMLTARTDELDKLTGLDNGADDYISKPFSPRELQSRINALFRRRGQSPAVDTAARSELERATEVQQSLLPKEDVRVEGYDLAGVFRPVPQRGRGLLRLVPHTGRPAPDVRRCHGQGHGGGPDCRHCPGGHAVHRAPPGP